MSTITKSYYLSIILSNPVLLLRSSFFFQVSHRLNVQRIMNSLISNFNSIINKLHPKPNHSKNMKANKVAKNNQGSRKGYIPLYVVYKVQKKRYEIPMKYFSHPTL